MYNDVRNKVKVHNGWFLVLITKWISFKKIKAMNNKLQLEKLEKLAI
ncbi:hypothetical protein HYD86_02475 [Mycoplasmopsis bovis]|nr:hypothetical protein [Mycoplasmopsis bovis]QQH36896.1 hypothetical protein HYD86_02475 [Mycoplasmopsis bovis]